jgi:hypothetical protein
VSYGSRRTALAVQWLWQCSNGSTAVVTTHDKGRGGGTATLSVVGHSRWQYSGGNAAVAVQESLTFTVQRQYSDSLKLQCCPICSTAMADLH